jgi:hypothetical protein
MMPKRAVKFNGFIELDCGAGIGMIARQPEEAYET